MSDEWAPGDLAVCVKTPIGCGCDRCNAQLAQCEIARGRMYVVDGVHPFLAPMGWVLGLHLAGYRYWYPVVYFRKVPPIEESDDREQEAPIRPRVEQPA